LLTFDRYIESIKDVFLKPLPGSHAQLLMAPSGRQNYKIPVKPDKAAVLLLLYPVNNEPYTVFIKRPEYPGPHSNQISFPGGKFEISDDYLQATAIRETIEELGNSLENIKIIGKLTPLQIPVSGFEVHPFVGTINYFPEWNPDQAEVSYVLETKVEELYNKATIKTENWNISGSERMVPFFNIKNEKIWGATAMILSEFIVFTGSSK
jgi:8-oxo-dGTP pyrophosphatase MutT (NUDIX family)